MTAAQPALLARLDAPRVKLIADTLAANPKASSLTKDMLEKQRKKGSTLAGSDVADLNKLIGAPARGVAEVLIFAATAGGAVAEPRPQEPLPPVVVRPPEPPPPASVTRSLLNEQVFTDTSGNRLGFQNDGKEGSTEYLGPGHYRFRLPAAVDGVIQGQRPSERVPKGKKRRSEGSGIRIAAPVGDQVVVIKCRYRFKPQAFAANMQWVMPFQLHGAGKTGSPWFAVRIEKGGWWLATINTSVSGKSTDLRPSQRFKPQPDVWQESEVRWSADRVLFYHNGLLAAAYDGRIGWDEEGVPYLKWGVYNSQGSDEATEVEIADLSVGGQPVGVLS